MSKISLKHSGGKVVSLNSPTTEPNANDVAFKLPNADGSAGQFMKTDGSGNLSFDAAGGGKILQVVQTVKTDTTSTTSASFVDISGMSRSIGFTSGNKVLVEFSASIGTRYGYPAFFQLHTNNGVVSGAIGDSSSNRQQCTAGGYIGNWDLEIARVHFSFLDSPADSVTEYKVKWRSNSDGNQAIYLNHDWSNQDNVSSPRTISTLTCKEVAV